jgi:hypothetical protein
MALDLLAYIASTTRRRRRRLLHALWLNRDTTEYGFKKLGSEVMILPRQALQQTTFFFSKVVGVAVSDSAGRCDADEFLLLHFGSCAPPLSGFGVLVSCHSSAIALVAPHPTHHQ